MCILLLYIRVKINTLNGKLLYYRNYLLIASVLLCAHLSQAMQL